jgi:hypothetical protein
MKREAYAIRKEIGQLKARLSELELESNSPEICSSSVCGHDEILANLKKMCTTFGHPSRAVVAVWEQQTGSERERWFSTTVCPPSLPYYVRSAENITRYLTLLSMDKVIPVLEFLFRSSKPQSLEAIITSFEGNPEMPRAALLSLVSAGYIWNENEKFGLEMKGWTSYIVLAHMTNVLELKLTPEKASVVAEAISDVYSVDWGEYLGQTFEKVVEDLSEAGWMRRL